MDRQTYTGSEDSPDKGNGSPSPPLLWYEKLLRSLITADPTDGPTKLIGTWVIVLVDRERTGGQSIYARSLPKTKAARAVQEQDYQGRKLLKKLDYLAAMEEVKPIRRRCTSKAERKSPGRGAWEDESVLRHRRDGRFRLRYRRQKSVCRMAKKGMRGLAICVYSDWDSCVGEEGEVP